MDYAMEFALMSDIYDEMLYGSANEDANDPVGVKMNAGGTYRSSGMSRFKNFWAAIWRAIKGAASFIWGKLTDLWNKITKKKTEAPAAAENDSAPAKASTPARLGLPGPTGSSAALPTSSRQGLPGPSAANAFVTINKLVKQFVRSSNEVVQVAIKIENETEGGNLTPTQIDKLMSTSRDVAEKAADANDIVLEQIQKEASRTFNYGGPTVLLCDNLQWTEWLKELKTNAETLIKAADKALNQANPAGDHNVSDDAYVRDLNAISKQLQKVTTNIGKILTVKVSSVILSKAA